MEHFKSFIGEYGVIYSKSGKILAAQLPKNSHHPGHWMLPGGRMDEGDSPTTILTRECREELGIDVVVLFPVHVAKWGNETPPKYTVFFLCKTNEKQPIKLNEELRSMKWVALDEATHLKWLNPHFLTAIRNAELIKNHFDLTD